MERATLLRQAPRAGHGVLFPRPVAGPHPKVDGPPAGFRALALGRAAPLADTSGWPLARADPGFLGGEPSRGAVYTLRSALAEVPIPPAPFPSDHDRGPPGPRMSYLFGASRHFFGEPPIANKLP